MSIYRDKRRKGGLWVYDFEVNRHRYQGDCVDPTGAPVRTKQQALDVPEGHDYAAGHKAFVDITDEDNQAYREHLLKKTVWKWTSGPNRKRDAPGSEWLWKDTGRPIAPRQVNKYLTALKALFTSYGDTPPFSMAQLQAEKRVDWQHVILPPGLPSARARRRHRP